MGGVGLFGGQGLLLNRLKGKGYAFLNAAGTLLHKRLAPGEQLVVYTHSLVAFENTVKYDIKGVGGAGMVFFGGQGLFNTVMTGPGLVIVQRWRSRRCSWRSAAADRGTTRA